MVYCNNCRKDISQAEYNYSTGKLGRALCFNCQKQPSRKNQPTPEALKLGEALKELDWRVEYEKWDKHKHIDIAITEARTNIEVDGKQHTFSKKQVISDWKRDFHSNLKGFATVRIENWQIRSSDFEEYVEAIDKFLNDRLEELEENEEDEDNEEFF